MAVLHIFLIVFKTHFNVTGHYHNFAFEEYKLTDNKISRIIYGNSLKLGRKCIICLANNFIAFIYIHILFILYTLSYEHNISIGHVLEP